MRGALLLVPLLAGCDAARNPAYEAEVATLAAAGAPVEPGLASCLLAIGRPDVAVDPAGDMSADEISELVACTAERARG